MRTTVFVSLLIACLCVAGCGGSTDPGPRFPLTVFAGDSIIGSEGATLVTDYGTSRYFNAGVYGYTSGRVREIFPMLLSGSPICYGFVSDPEPPYPDGLNCSTLPQAPQVVVVYAGWNDIFSISPPSPELAEATFTRVISNLDAMISQARAANVQIVICTLYHSDPAFRFPWSPLDPDPFGPWVFELNSDIRDLANLRGVPVADLETAFTGMDHYTVDGTHPNAAGFVLMKSTIQPILTKLGAE